MVAIWIKKEIPAWISRSAMIHAELLTTRFVMLFFLDSLMLDSLSVIDDDIVQGQMAGSCQDKAKKDLPIINYIIHQNKGKRKSFLLYKGESHGYER